MLVLKQNEELVFLDLMVGEYSKRRGTMLVKEDSEPKNQKRREEFELRR